MSSRNSRRAYSHVSHSPRGDGSPQRGQVVSMVAGEGTVGCPAGCAVAEGGCGVELFQADVVRGGATRAGGEVGATGAGGEVGATGAGGGAGAIGAGGGMGAIGPGGMGAMGPGG